MKRLFSIEKLRRWATWARARWEVLIPAAGLPLFFGMIGWTGGHLTHGQTVLVWGMAIAYAALVLWSPLALPAKQRQPITWPRLKRIALIVTLAMVAATALQMALYRPSSQSSRGGGAWALLLSIPLGIAGVAAEGTLPVDLFPVLRRREVRRILYVIAAALFLMALTQLWSGLWGGLARGIGSALGETPPASSGATSYFSDYRPLSLFVGQLFSAGIEELLFCVGVMTLVWALTRRWGWGLLASALCFGLYHITLSGMSDYFLQAPVTAVVQQFGMGLASGLIYRYRGFTTAVLVHAVGNWLLLMILAGAGV